MNWVTYVILLFLLFQIITCRRDSTYDISCEGICKGGYCDNCLDGYRAVEECNCCPVCEPKCVNSFCIAPGDCLCEDGYKKAHNSSNHCLPVCSNCENGTCTGPNLCTCLRGYQPKNGNSAECVPICFDNCSGYNSKPTETSIVPTTNEDSCFGLCTNGICADKLCHCFKNYINSPDNMLVCDKKCTEECVNGTCVDGICKFNEHAICVENVTCDYTGEMEMKMEASGYDHNSSSYVWIFGFAAIAIIVSISSAIMYRRRLKLIFATRYLYPQNEHIEKTNGLEMVEWLNKRTTETSTGSQKHLSIVTENDLYSPVNELLEHRSTVNNFRATNALLIIDQESSEHQPSSSAFNNLVENDLYSQTYVL